MSTGIAPSTWDQTAFEALMNAEAKDRRAGRKAFQPDASQNKYLTTGVDNYVTNKRTKLLTVGQGLTPITVHASVSIGTSFQDHPGLRTFAARQLGDALSYAEDAIVLLGSNAKPKLSGAGAAVPSSLSAVTLTVDTTANGELSQQIGLFTPGQPKVTKGKVIDSVVHALNNLRARGHHGPFVVIVSTDLNEEAWNPIAPGILEPPIIAVLPELRSKDDGWIWSDVVESREGVAISLGGETHDFIVAYDPHVESALVTNTFAVEAALQFRLRINDATAIEPLPKN